VTNDTPLAASLGDAPADITSFVKPWYRSLLSTRLYCLTVRPDHIDRPLETTALGQ
jgi:hypothetical protein